METVELKLYSPITANFIEDDNELDFDEGFDEFEGWTMDGHDLLYYEDAIREALLNEGLPEESERGLMHYYGKHEPVSVDGKVLSAFPDVEVCDGRLWGVLKCTLKEPLTAEELEGLKDYWTGQASDGLGEGFEQRPLKVDNGEMYVHLYQFDGYFVKTEKELKVDLQKKNKIQKHHRNAR